MLHAVVRALLRLLFIGLIAPLAALPIWLMIAFHAGEYFWAALAATIVIGVFLLTYGWAAVRDWAGQD